MLKPEPRFRHYSGKIGCFDYDSEKFTLMHYFPEEENMVAGHNVSQDRLVVNKSVKGKFINETILLPEGCIDTSTMFMDCEIGPYFSLVGFDKGTIVQSRGMFLNCVFREGSKLKDLNLSATTDTRFMFENCKFPNDFDLSSLDLSNVKYASDMFKNCIFSNNVDLSSLDLSNIQSMDCMFYKSKMSTGVKLPMLVGNGKNHIRVMNMFAKCRIPEDIFFGGLATMKNINKLDELEYIFGWLNEDWIIDGTVELVCKDGTIKTVRLQTEQEIVYFIKNNGRIKDHTCYTEIECMREALVLLNSYTNLREILISLKQKFTEDVIVVTLKQLQSRLKILCESVLPEILLTYNDLSISELKELLLDIGYPREIVEDCIIYYIRNKCLSPESKECSVEGMELNAYKKVEDKSKLSLECIRDIQQMFIKNKESELSIGDLKSNLSKKGYANILLNNCIVSYLGDECIQ